MTPVPTTLTLEQAVAVPMLDGVTLRADVWRPAGGARGPAILMRTPYGRHTHAFTAYLDPLAAARRGFATVIQDVRGRFDSDGEFEPYAAEAEDGAATIAWVAAQPWCDGRVVMTGHSYIGMTQWLAASMRPPALRAIAPLLTSAGPGEGWSFRNGVRERGFLASWVAGVLGDPQNLWLDEVERAYTDDDGLAAIAPWSAEWWRRGADDRYWQDRSGGKDVPAFVAGGWYDVFVTGTLRSWAVAATHAHDRLVLGPWGHDHWLPHLVGERNLGSAGNGAALGERIVDFYAAVLDGREPPGPRVQAYVLGAGRWTVHDAWPPPDAVTTTHEIRVGGEIGVDPGDLPPALGGRGLTMMVPDAGFGPRDQRPLTQRPDVLALPVADGPLTLAGPAAADLHVEATGGDTRDWVVILCVEEPGGTLVNVAEGVTRAPTGATRVDVPLGDVAVEVERRLVALVAGGLRPRWDPPPVPGTQTVRAGSTVSLTRLLNK